MKINVKVIANSSANLVEKLDDINYKVKVTVPAQEGRANKKVRELLARHFNIPSRNVNILAGERAKVKLIEIVNS